MSEVGFLREKMSADELREQRVVIGARISACKEEIHRLVQYRDTPPQPPRPIHNSATSGGIFQLTKEQVQLLRTMPEGDLRREALLEEMSVQADERTRLANEAGQRHYEEVSHAYALALSTIPIQLEQLHRKLEDLQSEYDAIQALIDKKMGRV